MQNGNRPIAPPRSVVMERRVKLSPALGPGSGFDASRRIALMTVGLFHGPSISGTSTA